MISGKGKRLMKLSKRLLTIAALLLVAAPAALAQSHDYEKWEFYGGYSAMKFDTLAGDTGNTSVDDLLGGKNTLRGFEFSITRNFHRYWGVMFDSSAHFRTDDFSRPAGSGNVHSNVQNYLGGIQIKNNEQEGPRFKPFGHALMGFAHQSVTVNSAQVPAIFGVSEINFDKTSFAMAFGGGLDIRLNHHLDVRAVTIDWNLIHRGDEQTGIVLVPMQHQTVGSAFVVPGQTQNNLRLGAGIVVHWH